MTATRIAERYQLEREMARGGMGSVWLARDEKLGRRVAVKVMSHDLAQLSEAQQRFEREAQAVAQLHSAHVVQVFDYGVQDGTPYIVMELLEGESLGQRLNRVGRISLCDASRLLVQICKGLKAAHGAGLVHRDIKPSNIFLAMRDDQEVVKLLDFGVVKDVDRQGSSDATASGMLLGTPQYMSPEQARATREIDHRSDLWSVAVILFRMLTGVSPFQGESVGDVVLKICSDDLPRVGRHAADLPNELDTFFCTAFGRVPEKRFQSAAVMANAFVALVRQVHPELPLTVSVDGAGSGEFPMPFAPAALGSRPEPPPPPPRSSKPGVPSFPGGPGDLTPLSGSLSLSGPSGAAGMSVPGAGMDYAAVSGSLPLPVRVVEPTPVSTTVAGTQVGSMIPPLLARGMRSPVTLGVAAAGALLVGGLLAAGLWSGSRGADVPPPAVSLPPPHQAGVPGGEQTVGSAWIEATGVRPNIDLDAVEATPTIADPGAAASSVGASVGSDKPPVKHGGPATASTKKQPDAAAPPPSAASKTRPEWF